MADKKSAIAGAAINATGKKYLEYSHLVPVLVAAIKELKMELEQVKRALH